MTNRRVGPYEILATIGEGGMGVVYKARDSRLDRFVALKVSREELSDGFRREARAIAALNHPNICTLYDVGADYLVMEFVEGRHPRGPMPVDEALRAAAQIADALDAAHARGIVHRDLKPANILITRNGTVKVLDFGIAKQSAALAGADDHTRDGTNVTTQDTVLGTPAYMSPEQAQGQPVDKRTDIWAFGVVLYEMLTGTALFSGASVTATLAAVLTQEPDLSRVPPRVRPLMRGCLERDRDKRLRDIGDARLLFDASSPDAIPAARTTSRLPWVMVTVLAAALIVAAVALSRARKTEPPEILRLNVDLGPDAVDAAGMPALSPDGKTMVWAARTADGGQRLLLRNLETGQDTALEGTDGGGHPFFSPDGQWIAFFSGAELRKISTQGGAAVRIGTATGGTGASWGDDDHIVIGGSTAGGLLRIAAAGGPATLMTKTGPHGDAVHRFPQVLPGSRTALFTTHKIVTGFDDASIEAVSLSTGERKVLLRGGYFGRYVPTDRTSGHLVYVHEGALLAVGFDPETLTVGGAPVPVLQDVAGSSVDGSGNFAFAASGGFIYRSGEGPGRKGPVLWLDGSGKTEPLVAEPGTYYTLRFSPDGTRLALAVDFGERGREIAVYDVARGSMTRLTFTEEVNLFPTWSPDGKFIAFESSSPAGYGIAIVRADGGGAPVRLLEHPGLMIPWSFSPDGKVLAFHQTELATGFDIWTVPVDTTPDGTPRLGTPTPFQRTQFAEYLPVFSPDGRWIAYTSNESGGRPEIYVRPSGGSGGKWRLSLDGGRGPMWHSDSKHLYFVAPDRRIMVVEYTEKDGALVAGKPRVWSPEPIVQTPFGAGEQTLAPFGDRVAILGPPASTRGTAAGHVTFVVGFFDDLRRRVH